MKKPLLASLCLACLAVTSAHSQDASQGEPATRVLRNLEAARSAEASSANHESSLTTFDLDFPGGNPQALVDAIKKATGKPLNAIIPAEASDIVLPPVKMTHVTVPDLFTALKYASAKKEVVSLGGGGGRSIGSSATFGGGGGIGGGFGGGFNGRTTYYGFETGDGSNGSGSITNDDTIWYFRIDKVATPPAPQDCRFYALDQYLGRGYSIDDITTAIHTAWDMQSQSGDGTPDPKISFHKETKLLIAVGDENKLQVIDQVLGTLSTSSAATDLTKDRLELQRMRDLLSSNQKDLQDMRVLLSSNQKALENMKNDLKSKASPTPAPSN